MGDTFRLDRLLANRGVGTRTEVTALIRRGRVKRGDTGEVVK
jgi:16S rRNA U516 pseudouridylate synthase RsuA-like enzyme